MVEEGILFNDPVCVFSLTFKEVKFKLFDSGNGIPVEISSLILFISSSTFIDPKYKE